MINLTKKDDVTPACPHCTAALHDVWFRELRGILGKRYVYFCSQCRKVLGITHRKGLWMG